ncbi:DUF4238 domain-containing protein [Listeria monocytogenes]|uniref:DUF4238 domain-containing protein n=1 Tax=Listeria monocytogenes TaxID=1639 RepID=UPI00135B7AA2|nr:DUF4238 domain-containing protein [Listeria monocytogenes]
MQVTKKQHYIPQGILKHFSDDRKKVFELYNNLYLSKKEIRDTMFQNFVYEHGDLPKNTIENSFARIENSFIPYHDKIADTLEANYLISQEAPLEEINELMMFYVLLYLRSGALLKEYAAYSDNPKSERIERLIKNLVGNVYPAELTNTILKGYEISILVDETEMFCMSDQFFSTVSLKFKNKFSNMSNRQIGFKDTMILIPISSKFYLCFYDGNKPKYVKPKSYCILTEEQTHEINVAILKNSYSKSVCKKELPLEQNKAKEQGIRLPERSMVVFQSGDISINTNKKEIEFYSSEEKFSKDYLASFSEYKDKYEGKVKRNDLCLCGSRKKYKKCCLKIHERCIDIFQKNNSQQKDWYSISSKYIVEESIEVFRGPPEEINNSRDREIFELLKKRKLERMR